ncbi:MAG: ATP-grasp domain-containing protein [Lachnospiraceae bacterium]|nr:ATP-grasp domain-containing protein [Lachnospiraceae bacterium]
MGRVWLKTKYDSSLGMEIPHSMNMANAMYGFRELGAEIIPYHLIEDIYDKVLREDIVLDYIDQVNMIFNKFHATYKVEDYPEVLNKYLGRKVWKDTINNISSHEEKWSAGYFVKPVRNKAFTGKIISSIKDLIGCGSCYEDYEVIVSEPIDILAEWRCFIRYDKIMDVRPYGSISHTEYEGYKYHYDADVLEAMINDFKTWEERPTACSMDICYTKDGRTLLVEVNDAYALGCYGLPGLLYAKLISARWSQVMEVEDIYNF